MAFSSGLTLADLSDYLAPSQLCIKPVTMVEDLSPDPLPTEVKPKDSTLATTEIVIDQEHGYYEVDVNGLRGKKLKKAEITLNDCLACSGCITSAESVLVSMQSHEEVYRVLEERADLAPILSIAPQSLASLAALHDLTLEEVLHGLRAFFKTELGFKLVFDTTFARSISLAENRLEFLERRAHALQSSAPTAVSLAESSLSPSSSSTGPLPILSSACPGWVCYAEKTHGELLPFVSNVKSEQAVMGTLVKGGQVAKHLRLKPDEIYHVSVMPCYDKKLEASRPDFATPFALDSTTTPTVRDVDCVLTTGEVQRMLDDKGISLPSLVHSLPPLSPSEEDLFVPSLVHAPGTSSGGYLHNTIHAVLSNLPVEELYRTKLEEKRVRSEDYVEFTLVASSIASTSTLPLDSLPASTTTKTLLRAAKCYGFRNLQNVVRKIGRDAGVSITRGAAGKLSATASAAIARRAALRKKASGVEEEMGFEFVEVMACPSGCVNGGGQIAPPKIAVGQRRVKGVKGYKGLKVDEEGMPDVVDRMEVDERVLSGKEWVQRVEQVYWEQEGESEEGGTTTLDWGRLDDSIKPFLSGESEEVVMLRQKVVDGLLEGTEGEERETRRRDLLRTSYRAVQSEEVNGLAVRW